MDQFFKNVCESKETTGVREGVKRDDGGGRERQSKERNKVTQSECGQKGK